MTPRPNPGTLTKGRAPEKTNHKVSTGTFSASIVLCNPVIAINGNSKEIKRNNHMKSDRKKTSAHKKTEHWRAPPPLPYLDLALSTCSWQTLDTAQHMPLALSICSSAHAPCPQHMPLALSTGSSAHAPHPQHMPLALSTCSSAHAPHPQHMPLALSTCSSAHAPCSQHMLVSTCPSPSAHAPCPQHMPLADIGHCSGPLRGWVAFGTR